MNTSEVLTTMNLSFISTTSLVIVGILVSLGILGYFLTFNLLDHFKKPGAKEKRRQARMSCNYLMDVWHPQKRILIAQARVLDLSGKGAHIACMARMNPGDPIIGRILQTEHGDINITGRVMWKRMTVTSPLYGIRFDPA